MFITFLSHTTPFPTNFPRFPGLLDENLRRALCKNEGWANFNDGDCDAVLESDFGVSFTSVAADALGGLASVVCEYWFFGVFGVREDCEVVDCGLEVDENFELILDIHEFRLPGELDWPDLGSLELFAGC